MNYETYKKEFNLPDSPGVYFFKSGKKILYIGKATSLKDRARSYFMPDLIHTRGSRIVDMVTKSDRIEYEETDNVLEALIKEAYLIKKYKPDANIKEKDDKSFNFVVVTKEPWPRIYIIRERNLKFEDEKFSNVFGPFLSKKQIEQGLKIIRKIFPFRMEKTNHDRFYQQLELAPKISGEKEAQKEYKKTIGHIVTFLKGKKQKLVKDLEKEMLSLAKKEEFEKASSIKRKIFALNHIRDVSLISSDDIRGSNSGFRMEAYDVAHISGTSTVGVMTVSVDGEVDKSEYKKFKIRSKVSGDDLKALEELLVRRIKHSEWGIPDVVVIDGGKTQRAIAKKVLSNIWPEVNIVNVVKNKQHKADSFIGDFDVIKKHKPAIILLNSEAHRFAVSYHKNLRSKASGIVKNKNKRP